MQVSAKSPLPQAILQSVSLYCASFVFFIACSKAQFYIPMTPIPITLHTFAIAVMGCLLPLRVALTCFAVYMAEGLVGSPFFGTLLSTTGIGYYVGMFVAICFLNQATKHSPMSLLTRLIISSCIIWFFGVFYLQFLIGLKKAILLGVVPFIIGNAIKLILAYIFIKLIQKKKPKLLEPLN